jgi:cytochrome c oxidase cbb3-type subunit 3
MRPRALALLLGVAACQDRSGGGEASTPEGLGAGGVAAVPVSTLLPGPPTDVAQVKNPFAGDERAIATGKRLFLWYNCAGCHGAQGGGGIGPPFIDADWIYGGGPGQIYLSIVQGRPNGMPSFGRRITEEQVWQIAAYVESLGGEMPGTGGEVDVRNPEGLRNDNSP